RLGRVAVDDVLDRSAWEFRTAEGEWSSDIHAAAGVAGLMVRPPTVSYNGYLDRFVAIVPTGGTEVAIQTAPEPWGPWSAPTPMYDWAAIKCPTVDVDADADGPIAAPWLDDGGGRVVRFAFARPGPDFGRDPTCPGEVRLVSVDLA
ncbi:MAG TPA: hypothetical protein VK507_07920, partial [Iamia sp.]|nr:hypothetical protein [Iamia sp.]